MPLLPAILPGATVLAAKAAGVLVLAFGVGAAIRRGSAAARHALWTTALAVVLLLPVAALTMPALPIPVLAAAAAGDLRASHVGGPGADAALSLPTVIMPSPDGRTDSPETAGWAWTHVAAAAWLTGALALALRIVIGALGLWRIARRARLACDPRLLTRVRHLSDRLGIRRRVDTLIAPDEWIPMARGVLHPVILLPGSAVTWSHERLDGVLLHELAHIGRFDAVSHLVARLAVALFWFNPLAWLAAREARVERERACDDVVLGHGALPSRYAADLLALAGSLATPPAARTALAMARRPTLERRIVAIVDGDRNRRTLSWRSAAVAAILAALALPAGAAHLTARPAAATPIDAGAVMHAPVAANAPAAIAATQPLRQGAVLPFRKATLAMKHRSPEGAVPSKPADLVVDEQAPAQAPRPPVDFSGTWIPDDAARVQAWFEVGMSRYPGSGMTISQDARTFTVHTAFPSIRGQERTAVYRLDGSESTNLGPHGIINGPEVSRARWDGDRLVITTTRPNTESERRYGVVFEFQEIYSMEGGRLTIECSGLTYREVRRFHRKDADGKECVTGH